MCVLHIAFCFLSSRPRRLIPMKKPFTFYNFLAGGELNDCCFLVATPRA